MHVCMLTERRLNGFRCYKIYQLSCATLQFFFFLILTCTIAPFTHRFNVRNTDLLSFLLLLLFLWKVIFLRSLKSVSHVSVVVVYSFSPVMSWTKDRDLILCREVANVDPYMTKKGYTQRSNIWKKCGHSK